MTTELIYHAELPKFMADWLERFAIGLKHSNEKGQLAIELIKDIAMFNEDPLSYLSGESHKQESFNVYDDIATWVNDNPFTFLSAILHGYNVQQERVEEIIPGVYLYHTESGRILPESDRILTVERRLLTDEGTLSVKDLGQLLTVALDDSEDFSIENFASLMSMSNVKIVDAN